MNEIINNFYVRSSTATPVLGRRWSDGFMGLRVLMWDVSEAD